MVKRTIVLINSLGPNLLKSPLQHKLASAHSASCLVIAPFDQLLQTVLLSCHTRRTIATYYIAGEGPTITQSRSVVIVSSKCILRRQNKVFALPFDRLTMVGVFLPVTAARRLVPLSSYAERY